MTVNLSLETATRMYNSGDESLKAFALDNYPELNPLPIKFEDLKLIDGYYLQGAHGRVYYTGSSINSPAAFLWESQAKAAIALAKLSQLKAVYNAGWEPTYNGKEAICTILISNNVPIAGTTRNASRFLTFKSEELRDKFLKHFRDLIMEAKPLL